MIKLAGPSVTAGKLLWVSLGLIGLIWITPVMAESPPGDICADCHDDIVESFGQTPHGVYFQDNMLTGGDCTSCHGNGVEHIQGDGDPELIINPANADQFGAEKICMSCHSGRQFDDWQFSGHHSADVNCASCHKVHQSGKQSAIKTEPDLCYECHSDVKAATQMPSHHPIAEGKMVCSDCHAVHGGEASFTMDGSDNELCFSCHANKEGPFMYEHAPVTEDCKLCHAPHGSVADNLLTLNEPALCLNCHAMHFHATNDGIDGPFTPPLEPDRGGISTRDGLKAATLTKCTQCHQVIHGTDLPSQTTSTGGNALTR